MNKYEQNMNFLLTFVKKNYIIKEERFYCI